MAYGDNGERERKVIGDVSMSQRRYALNCYARQARVTRDEEEGARCYGVTEGYSVASGGGIGQQAGHIRESYVTVVIGASQKTVCSIVQTMDSHQWYERLFSSHNIARRYRQRERATCLHAPYATAMALRTRDIEKNATLRGTASRLSHYE